MAVSSAMIWLVPALLAGLAALAAGLFLGRRVGRREALRDAGDTARLAAFLGDGRVFLFDGTELRAASHAGQEMLADLPTDDPPWERLLSHLAAGDAEITASLEALLADGTAFAAEIALADGRLYDLVGEPRGALAALIVRDIAADRAARRTAEQARVRLQSACGRFDRLLDAAPILLWRSVGERVTYANGAYLALFGAEDLDDLPDLSSANASTPGVRVARSDAGDGAGPARVAVSTGLTAEAAWYDVTTAVDEDGARLCFAVDAGPVMQAEAALRNFVATLTETFAHLPIGLAIFDKARQLGLFNPSLSSLLQLDPAWMAGRPTLGEFLEKLREARTLPDQADFQDWRQKLVTLEATAADGQYEETWYLPDGRTLRVTGRPHPQGAIAFLFEDITTARALESRYRSALELREGALDGLHSAVCVFDSAGVLVFANTAFTGVWGFAPDEEEQPSDIQDVLGAWQAASEPSPVWARLLGFATGAENRSGWTARIRLRDGRLLRGRFAPLKGGATMMSFSDITNEERALARLTTPERREGSHARSPGQLDTALADLRALLRDGESVDSGGEHRAALLARLDEIAEGAGTGKDRRDPTLGDLLAEFEANAASKEITLEVALGPGVDLAAAVAVEVSRELSHLGRACIDRVPAGAHLALRLEEEGGRELLLVSGSVEAVPGDLGAAATKVSEVTLSVRDMLDDDGQPVREVTLSWFNLLGDPTLHPSRIASA
ncbi:MAG: PAS-domain containing protein [Pseudomonadota bacterium]